MQCHSDLLPPVVFQLADWVYGSTGKPACGCFGVYEIEGGGGGVDFVDCDRITDPRHE